MTAPTRTRCPRCARLTTVKQLKLTAVGKRCQRCRDRLPSGKRHAKAT